MAQSSGGPVAVLCEPVSPDAVKAGEHGEAFSSPWRTIRFDRVTDVSKAAELATSKGKINLTNSRGSATKEMTRGFWEASIPLSVLGIKPAQGTALRADLGVLVGSGGETVQRIYWSNPAGGLVNDVPGEAMLQPQNWGTWKLGR